MVQQYSAFFGDVFGAMEFEFGERRNNATPAAPCRRQSRALRTLGAAVGSAVAVWFGASALSEPGRAMMADDLLPMDVTAAKVGQMLPEETIATVIVDVGGDWQGINQFDTFPQEIEGLPGFPMMPAIPGRDFEATLRDWAGEHVAIAWVRSDVSEQGSYLVSIAPLADRAAAAGYREALSASWPGNTATQTYRGVEILVLQPSEPQTEPPTTTPDSFAIPDSESEAEPAPDLAPEPAPEPPSDELPTLSLTGAIEFARKAIAQPEETLAEKPVEEIASAFIPPGRQFAIAQLDDRLVFATSAKDLLLYIDDLDLGSPLLPDAPAEPAEPAELAEPGEPSESNELTEAIESEVGDVLLPAPTLAQNPDFRRMLDREPADPAAAIVYADMPRLVEAFRALPLLNMPAPDGTVPSDAFAMWDDISFTPSTLEAFLWFEASGARLQFRAYTDEPQPQLTALTRPDEETLAQIPASSALALTTRGLDIILPELLAAYDRIPQIATQLDIARDEIRANLGLYLDTEILPLFDGDLAFFVFPTTSNRNDYHPLTGFSPIGIAMTVETSDRPTFERLLGGLDRLWSENTGGDDEMVALELQDVEGFEVTSWNAQTFFGAPASFAAHTWVTDDTLLLVAGAPLISPLVPEPYLSLSDDFSFQAGFEPFDRPSVSRLHVNFGTVLTMANAFVGPAFWNTLPVTPEFDPARAIRSLRSLSESTQATDEYFQDELHLRLAPRQSDAN